MFINQKIFLIPSIQIKKIQRTEVERETMSKKKTFLRVTKIHKHEKDFDHATLFFYYFYYFFCGLIFIDFTDFEFSLIVLSKLIHTIILVGNV